VKGGLIVDMYLPAMLEFSLSPDAATRRAMTHVTLSSQALTSLPRSRSPSSFHNPRHPPCAAPQDNMSEVGPSSPYRLAESPLTVPSSSTPTPEPLNRMPERDFWVELRHPTAEERDYRDFHLNLRQIVAEHAEGSEEFYYVLLGDNKHHKVRASDARTGYIEPIH